MHISATISCFSSSWSKRASNHKTSLPDNCGNLEICLHKNST